MNVYNVTKSSGNDRITNDYNLTVHDSDAYSDPTNHNLPLGRKFLAKNLTYKEANEMKHKLDLEQGTAPIQLLSHSFRNPIPPDAKPSTKTIITPPNFKKSTP